MMGGDENDMSQKRDFSETPNLSTFEREREIINGSQFSLRLVRLQGASPLLPVVMWLNI
jgi:hypothetical protein